MEAKTVINLTIDSYNNNDPKHGLRGIPGLAPNLITRRKEQQVKTYMNTNGISNCQTNGEERFEYFTSGRVARLNKRSSTIIEITLANYSHALQIA